MTINTVAVAGLVMEGAMASTATLLPLSPVYPCFTCYKLNLLLLSYNYCLRYWPHSGWPIVRYISHVETMCCKLMLGRIFMNSTYSMHTLYMWNWPCDMRHHWVHGYPLPVLTLNVQGPSYLGLTRSISWLLMTWLRASPGHQQPWYWLCRIGRSLSCLRKYFNFLCHTNVEEWHKM